MAGFRVRTGVLAALVACTSLGSAGVGAQESTGDGDPKRGKELAYTCLGCHGIPGYKNAYPNYSVPKLEGQYLEYMVTALQAYKSGERSHMTMHSQAQSLSEQDMRDVAAYFAGQPIESGGIPKTAQAPEAAQICIACHGEDGVGITSMYPILSGQHADYLVRALREYKKGGRKNAIMAGFAAELTDEQIEQLAEYYSRQQPGLQTVERPYTVLSAGNN